MMEFATRLDTLLRCSRGAGAAEFAMVLPVFLLFLFGVIDGGRLLWEINRAEKATQVGARFAIVTDPVSPDLIDADYESGTLAAGELIPHTELGTLKCTNTACTCEATPCPGGGGAVDSTAFTALVTRMQQIYGPVTAANVEVRYSGSGFGYAGDLVGGGGGGGGGGATDTMEVSPLVTVSIKNLQFKPITLLLFASFTLPGYSTTLTAEDASGSYSN